MKVYRVILAGILGGALCASCVSSPNATTPDVLRRTGGTKIVPSASPTGGATAQPTGQPTDQPTGQPSGQPTSGASATPTPGATGTPDATGTAAPFFAEVLGTNGSPAVGARVDAYTAAGGSAGAEVTTDSAGKFKPASGWSMPANLVVTGQDGSAAIAFNVASSTANLKLQLAATGTIAGTLKAPNITGTPDFSSVFVNIPGTPYHQQAVTSGAFTFTNLPADATGYDLTASSTVLGSGNTSAVVVGPGKTASATISLSASTPTVSSLSVNNGGPGMLVTITGSHFGTNPNAVKVAFDNTDSTNVTLQGDTSLTAEVPAQATTGNVTVTVNGLASNGKAFQVIQAITITGSPTISANGTQAYTATATDTSANPVTNPNLIWAATGSGISVSPSGVVTAGSTGSGTLIASSGNVNSAPFAVAVQSAQITVSTFAGAGTLGTTDGTGTGAKFNGPSGLIYDPTSQLYYMTDEYQQSGDANSGCTVRSITTAAKVTTIAGQTGTSSSGSANGTGSAAQFATPNALAVDSHGNLFVTDFSNNSVRKVTSAGAVTTFASGLQGPWGICADASDNLYVTEDGNPPNASNTAVVKISPTGTVSNVAGALFNFPQGIAVDGSGNLYVADGGANKIWKIASGGATITVLAGSGSQTEADGNGQTASFNNPCGVAVDSAGNVYVTDQGGNTIRKIDPNGAVSTLVGPSGGLKSPSAIILDSQGNLYVADNGNFRIVKVTLH